MLRVASNALIVPPFECAWLSLGDYNLQGACCLQFECKGENDVTIILKPFPGAKRWQHLQRQQGPAGGEHLAVEQNYTVILGSHRNSKLKIEKNGEEKAVATGLPGCTVSPHSFTTCWINYCQGCISVGTGAAGSALSFQWQDPEPAIPDIRNIGLSCWDKHVSYRNVQLLQPVAAAQLQQLAQQQRQLQQQVQHSQLLAGQPWTAQDRDQQPVTGDDSWHAATAAAAQQQQQPGHQVPSLLQLVMQSTVDSLAPASICHVLQLSELLLPRTQQLYDAAVQLAGRWFGVLVRQHIDELAGLSVDVMADILHEPLLDVPELSVFQAVAAWCQYGSQQAQAEHADSVGTQGGSSSTSAVSVCGADESTAGVQELAHQQQLHPTDQPEQQPPCELLEQMQAIGAGGAVVRAAEDVQEVLQLVRFAVMPEGDIQAVLHHPFTQCCPYVKLCLQQDLQRFREGNHSSSPQGAYTFEQRRIVRPAASLASARNCCTGDAKQPDQHSSFVAAATADVSKAAAVCSTASCSSSLTRSGSSSSARAIGWRKHHQRRLAPSCKELMYVCDGDCNGVIRYIGTEYGTKQWVNPVAAKALDIKASSPPSRYTDPKALVSGQFLNTSFAGPRYIRTPTAAAAAAAVHRPACTAAIPSTWWQLDLGQQHRLLCNYYTIRHDGSHEGFVRSWVLQGSNDLQHWVDLRRHRHDTTIRLPGQYGSWPITGPAASMPFRAFRLLLLGPTQSHTNPWAYCLSYWELYGYFYKLDGSLDLKQAAAA